MNVLKTIAILSLFAFALLPSQLEAQCEHAFDLNTFAPVGPLDHANWVVNGSGTTASQESNTFPSFYLSPMEFSAVRMRGTLTVSPTAEDDDYLGLVFGVQSPHELTENDTYIDLWMVDWKSEFQTNSEEGLSLVRVERQFDFDVADSFMPYFWNHNSIDGFTIKGTQYGEGTGWVHNQTYQLELVITPNHITFLVDGNIIFDRDECVQPGRVGFYSFSQTGGAFSDFTWQALPAATLPQSVCLGEEISATVLPSACGVSPNLATNAVTNWSWGYGNGNGTSDMEMSYAYTSTGVFALTQTVTDQTGCVQQFTSPVVVENGPLALFQVEDGCVGEPVQFTNQTAPNGSLITGYAWDFDGDGTVDSEEEHPSYTYATPEEYNATLIAATSGCSDTVSIPVALLPSPTASFTASQVGLTSSFLFENFSTDADTYLWDFGEFMDGDDTSTDSDPSWTYSEAGDYTVVLTAMAGSGCAATDSLIITAPDDRAPFMPTAFSPNGDGRNDFFRPVDQNVTAMEMLVFNTWGELIFTGNELTTGWDGTAKGQPAEQGNYTYRVVLDLLDGRTIHLAGNISLIR